MKDKFHQSDKMAEFREKCNKWISDEYDCEAGGEGRPDPFDNGLSIEYLATLIMELQEENKNLKKRMEKK